MSVSLLLVYIVPIGMIWMIYAVVCQRAESRSRATKEAAEEAGLVEPASLHPVIDPAICLGCGSCVKACPEGDIIGLISGKAELVEPTHCIGHGACRTA